MHDLIIRGGTVVDGTGKASLTADVAVKDGLVVEVGHITEQAKRTMDAQGLLVRSAGIPTCRPPLGMA